MFNQSPYSAEQEEQRLEALYSYDILGDGLEHELDNLVKLAAQIANVPIAYVSFVDRDSVILKSAVGVEAEHRKLPKAVTICQYTMMADHIFLMPDVTQEPELSSHPLVNSDAHIRFYASAPLKDSEGFALGCLCLLDVQPRNLNEHQLEALSTLAVQVVAQLALKRKNAQLEAQTKRFDEFVDIFTVSPEIHCILDRNGAILFINDAVTSLLQYTVEETIGQSMWNYCLREDVDRTVYAIEDGLRSGEKQFSIDFRLVSKYNQVKWMGWNMVAKDNRWYCYGRDITESKKVENELTKLSFVASKVNNGVVINDANNNAIWVNDAFEKITGFTLEEVKGKPLGDLICGPETDWSLIEKARQLTQQKQSFTVDILAYRKDKQPIWLSIYNTVVLDDEGKVETEVEIIIDITEKKKAEEELQVLSLVASKTNTGVTISNEKGEITWINDALEGLIGYSLAELSGKMLGDVLSTPDTDKELILKSRKKANNKQAYTIEVLAHKKDGTPIWLSVANTPIINVNGQLERQVELIYDITQRKQVEREMVEAREQALQLSEAKEMFLSVMSHEIRTPLNAVIGMTHLLLENEPKDSQIDDLNILKFSGENLLNIINDILDFTKIETGNLQLEALPFDLHTLCVDIVNSLQVAAGKKGNQLLLTYDDKIPEQLLGDKTRLYQIVMNLLGNAIKFTDHGKVEFTLKLKQQTSNEALIYFEVSDNGIGIPKEKQSYIFETFTQARTDISRKYGGTGLGLAITKKLIKLYQSEIEVQSVEGKGTVFCFEISFKLLGQPEKAQVPAALPSLFTGKRILVVDDNEVNILIAKRFLSKWGLDIDFASNGEEAIRKIMDNVYDLVFMDIRMPGIDGFDTTRIVREIPGAYYKNLPIIALTASTLHNENMKFRDCGMNGHVLKPFNPEEIKQVLHNFLKK
ncbi:PAS domain S-box protein [Pedobacter sp. KR3-3]|uniref:histidine kinase n=1 Tax=Pedobacter albus TaxID=3113905 RepID=A0ABU7IBM2_9SPHI|nr:PAS domain S-box protein [Pedobacter sp. KR3-3]MEE1946862.1 PAS domain S-box protein [Pedobacter sp. KR3-3]